MAKQSGEPSANDKDKNEGLKNQKDSDFDETIAGSAPGEDIGAYTKEDLVEDQIQQAG